MKNEGLRPATGSVVFIRRMSAPSIPSRDPAQKVSQVNKTKRGLYVYEA
jgi:hypothetical protein